MRDLYKIFAKLESNNIGFCFQCQGGKKFYNLSITTPIGKMESFSSDNVEAIEQQAKMVWGHLLNDVPSPTVKGMPMPLPR